MSEVQNDYYIGLDVGTNSVGWAVTDKQYRVLRKKVNQCGESDYLKKLKLRKKEE